MKIERSKVTKLVLTGAFRLDPITVFLEDIGPRQGKIVIECYGKSWSGYWGGMGERTIAEFFCSCSGGYIANKISDTPADITDAESIADGARRQILKLRRGELMRSFGAGGRGYRIGRNEITAEQARDMWGDVDTATFGNDGWGEAKLMQEIFGDEWWYSVPTKPNPDYQYLKRVIEAVQDGLRLAEQETAAAAAQSVRDAAQPQTKDDHHFEERG